MRYIEKQDDEVVEGFDDSEDDRTNALVDVFEGIDVTLTINRGT